MSHDVRPVYGFFLALVTAFLWGILPIFLTLCLQAMDSPTITLYRFASAGVVVGLLLVKKRQLGAYSGLSQGLWLLCIGATFMLVINYVTNVMGLEHLSPASVQVLMQIAPFALMVGGVVFYKEQFNRIQLVGAVCLLVGLALFFNQRLSQIAASESEDFIGIVFVVVAALSWAMYALCQKVLLGPMSAMQLTLLLYVFGSAMLLPFSEPVDLTNMNSVQLGALVFCCLNTLVAYGAFTEALRIWYASRVSAVLALAPLFTYLSMLIAEQVQPAVFTQPELGGVAYLGGVLVIVGSVVAALGRERFRPAA
ncbi:DMT family transporter [Alteromonas aestuariivivens]|uniref:DMT family transporter n=1 Tax=Alteromonas aestuariivivens TaxID=1938339 RepID=UPI001FEC6234|nr:DMT family transporter [Alteromonas aestuariivivens]